MKFDGPHHDLPLQLIGSAHRFCCLTASITTYTYSAHQKHTDLFCLPSSITTSCRPSAARKNYSNNIGIVCTEAPNILLDGLHYDVVLLEDLHHDLPLQLIGGTLTLLLDGLHHDF
eukprot:6699883-Heterocapsa_arctica.AAC.1